MRELTDIRREKGCGKNCNSRFGVNVVPLTNPKQVMFKDQVNIPWRNATCSNSDWTQLTGKVTTSEKLDWSKWDMKEVKDKRCKSPYIWMMNYPSTLRNAVLYVCSFFGGAHAPAASQHSQHSWHSQHIASTASIASPLCFCPHTLSTACAHCATHVLAHGGARYCSVKGRECNGFAVHKKVMDDAGLSIYDDKKFSVYICRHFLDREMGKAPHYSPGLIDDVGWVTYIKTEAEREHIDKPVTPPEDEYVGVSFGPTHVPISRAGATATYSSVPLQIGGYPKTGMWFHQFGSAFGTEGARATPAGMAPPSWLEGGSGSGASAKAEMGWDCEWDYSPGAHAMTTKPRTIDATTQASNFNYNNWWGGLATQGTFCRKKSAMASYEMLTCDGKAPTDPPSDCSGSGTVPNLTRTQCRYIESEVIAANVTVPIDYKEVYIAHLERAKCSSGSGAKYDVQNEWGLGVKNGVYHVVVGTGLGMATLHTKPQRVFGQPRNWNRGCTVENTRFVGSTADYTPNEYTTEVEVSDGRLSLKGTSSGGRLLFCQSIRYLKIRRIGDALRGPWAPIARTTKGAWWQMELDALTPVGLVSVAPITSTAFHPDDSEFRKIKDDAVFNIDCRHWWLYKGRGCPDVVGESGLIGLVQQNPLGRFRDGGTKSGVVISISNVSCVGEECDAAGQHMCNTGGDGTPGKSTFDRPAFNKADHNLVYVTPTPPSHTHPPTHQHTDNCVHHAGQITISCA